MSYGIARVNVTFGNAIYPFYHFDTPASRGTCEDVWTGKSYPIQPYFGAVHTVFDVGANVGATTLYFALHFPQARIFAFEPTPRSYDLLVRNTRMLTQVRTYNFGLADLDQRASLYLGSGDSVTNSVCSSPHNTVKSVKVKIRAARAVLAQEGVDSVDILKVDTEGCEVPILISLADLLPHVGVLFVEYHDDDDRLEIDRLLRATHLLCQGRVLALHRGELCYFARSRLPSGFRGLQIPRFSCKKRRRKASRHDAIV
jgi:FkbM family methyltransferase